MADHPPGGESGNCGHGHGNHHLPADDRHWHLQPRCGTDLRRQEEVREHSAHPCIRLCPVHMDFDPHVLLIDL